MQREAFIGVLSVLDKAIESEDSSESTIPDYIDHAILEATLKELERAADGVRDYKNRVERSAPM